MSDPSVLQSLVNTGMTEEAARVFVLVAGYPGRAENPPKGEQIAERCLTLFGYNQAQTETALQELADLGVIEPVEFT